MNTRIELLTYEKALNNKQNIFELMKALFGEDEEEYCLIKTKDMLSFIKNGSAIVAAAFYDDTVIGYAWGYLRTTKTLRIHITQLIVNESYRGQGIAKRLLNFMEEECIKHKCEGLELNVAANNKLAQQLYFNNQFLCETLFLTKKIECE